MFAMLYMLTSVGLPSLHGYYARMVFWVKGAFWKPLFHVSVFSFCLVETLLFGGGGEEGVPLWHLWMGGAQHPGLNSCCLAVEVFNVGGSLTHGDLVLDTKVDFSAVVSEWSVPGRHLLRTLPMFVILGLVSFISLRDVQSLAYLCDQKNFGEQAGS